MIQEEALARMEILRLIKKGPQKRYWLVKTISERLRVDGEVINNILYRMQTEGTLRIEDTGRDFIVSIH